MSDGPVLATRLGPGRARLVALLESRDGNWVHSSERRLLSPSVDYGLWPDPAYDVGRQCRSQ